MPDRDSVRAARADGRHGRPLPGVKEPGPRDAYRAAGVDVDAGERAVSLMRAAIASTSRPEVIGGIGGFAAAVNLPAGLRDPVLVASTDGVGTKTAIARAVGRLDTVGIDLVAMCADDLACAGAAPLFLLDYVAVGRLVPEEVAALVGGVAAGCRLAGCALVGGETAEHPGLLEPGAFDLAATCVGAVERTDLLDGSAVAAGDRLVGLAASGLHSNGFSLVRRLIADHGLDLAEPYAAVLARHAPRVEPEPDLAAATLGEALLVPTRVYAQVVLAIRAALRAAGADLHGAAHVTGGGLPGNVPRIVPEGLGARLHPGRWPIPPVMRLVAALGGLDAAEVRATFNGGLGMVLAVPPEGVGVALAAASAAGIEAIEAGKIGPVDVVGGRYVEVGEGRPDGRPKPSHREG
ncbi:MAG: phosphoribosylformylglycinamidine cyclo-ligase [Chloroflexi bacterium]|nr:phosphoribosylformylglycinamidine cyclo-ligase [Chloroflexota bacterium]